MLKKHSRTQNTIRNITTGFLGQMLSILFRFATRTVFIKTFGSAYLGINGLFADILSMLSLAELGIDTALNYKLYKPLASGDERRVRSIMKFYKRAYTVVGLVVFFAGLLIIPLLPVLIRDYRYLEPLGINAEIVFFMYLLQSATSYLFFASRSAIIKADQRQYVLNVAGYLITLITSVLQIVVMFVFKNYILYIGVLVGVSIIQNYIYAIIAKRSYPYAFIKDKESLSKEEIKETFKDLGALFIYKVNSVVLKATDNIVLSSFIGLSIVGLYSNYLMLLATIYSLLAKIYDSAKASLGNLFAIETTSKKYDFFEVMNFLSIILYGTAGVGFAVVANELIECWIGPTYVIAYPFSVLIGIEIIFHGIKANLGQIINVTGAFRQLWFRPLIGTVINLIVSILLVNFCGIYGVIIGTIVADFSANFLLDPRIIYKVSFSGYRTVSNYYKKNLLYFAILLAVYCFDYYICNSISINGGWFSVAIHIIICGCSVPCGMIVLFNKQHECQFIISLCRRVLQKIFGKEYDS